MTVIAFHILRIVELKRADIALNRSPEWWYSSKCVTANIRENVIKGGNKTARSRKCKTFYNKASNIWKYCNMPTKVYPSIGLGEDVFWSSTFILQQIMQKVTKGTFLLNHLKIRQEPFYEWNDKVLSFCPFPPGRHVFFRPINMAWTNSVVGHSRTISINLSWNMSTNLDEKNYLTVLAILLPF